MKNGLIAIPDKLPNDTDGAPTIFIVNIPTTVIELVTYDDQRIMEERLGGNVVIADWVGRLIPIVRHPMGDVARWTDYNSQKFWLYGRVVVAVRLRLPTN